MKKNEIKKGVDDLYTRYAHTLEMLEQAVDKIDALQKLLDNKPKEVIVERVVEKEIEIEIIKEIEVEKVVEVKVEVPVEKETVVTVEKEVPGPERIVKVPGPERIVNVPGPERVVLREDTSKIEELEILNQKLKNHTISLQKELNTKSDEFEIEIVEKESTKDLRHAANIMAASELNKEDLSADNIYNILVKSSEEELKQKLGFWAVPLPKKGDIQDTNTNLRYTRKK
jgi:hypothetical protein|tara:strand:- start:466 stop:1149 length:684 start_codon:yes stop_codon:yes gene_type:complete